MDRSRDCLPGMMPAVTTIATALGQVCLIWVHAASEPKVRRIILPGDPRSGTIVTENMPSIEKPRDKGIQVLIAGIQSFLMGNDIHLTTDLLDLDRCPSFQRRVLLAEYGIPRGYVSTYGRIARHLGNPGAARAVGNALARNPFPIVIPCHRALRANGQLGGFQSGQVVKRRLLEMEGVRFRGDGRVIMERVWY
ncbi:methylated-DNA--[protein]-cysteine S-methyltransferase [Methanoculleus taiwanensis]|uniref:methylated-DNA--[protein]-cysteine S-methyltransferase n=1 Tax=Methanoculleus taiwanensis TaxID=1550565 RepID=UPI001F4F42C0|nr:methylated-DNA--[protein]-cysteine S-methyltransferase [Methanoculleus taiwanensis]